MNNGGEFTFDLVYKRLELKPYTTFTSMDGKGIPYLVKLFITFEPQNTIYPLGKFKTPQNANLVHFHHLMDYLVAPELQMAPTTRKYDAVVNAIVSYILGWTSKTRIEFARMNPQYDQFVKTVEDFVQYEGGRYVYAIEFEGQTFACCKCAFKLIKPLIVKQQLISEPEKPFQLTNHLSMEFVNHLHVVYKHLLDEDMTPEIISELEIPHLHPIPYNIEDRIGDYAHLKRTARLKFITGQACVGKTTLLMNLRDRGWTIMSRGRLGGFSGKTENPVAVAALHASIEFGLGHSNVLGVSKTYHLRKKLRNRIILMFLLIAGSFGHRQSAMGVHHGTV